ncbi:MAG: EamA family transporter [Dehalococcoidia bacterium]
MWALWALASAASHGIIAVLDKRLLDHHLPGVSVLYLWIALVLAVDAVLVLLFTGFPASPPTDQVVVAFASGLSFGVGLAFMFVGLRMEEASRAIAIPQIYPVFVAMLAVMFLGETLNQLQWGAIVLVVVGTMLVSLREVPDRSTFRPSWGLPILVGSGLFLGLTFFAGKYSLADLSVWTVFALQQIGNVVAFTVFARPRVWRQLFAVLRRRNTLILLLTAEGPMPFVAIILGLQAAKVGPISLVSAFLATMPLFVFFFSVGLSHGRWRFLEESLNQRSLALKFVSIVIIVLGVSFLGLP